MHGNIVNRQSGWLNEWSTILFEQYTTQVSKYFTSWWWAGELQVMNKSELEIMAYVVGWGPDVCADMILTCPPRWASICRPREKLIRKIPSRQFAWNLPLADVGCRTCCQTNSLPNHSQVDSSPSPTRLDEIMKTPLPTIFYILN